MSAKMDVTLTAETGRPTGSRNAGRLRADGKVPGVVYGMGQEPTSVQVAWPELRKALSTKAGLNALIDLTVDGSTLPGVYAAGEIAGFGGGGVHGYRSLEGTFLGSCLFTGRTAGRALAAAL